MAGLDPAIHAFGPPHLQVAEWHRPGQYAAREDSGSA